ncbi:MAG: hypothetical protein NTZ95_06470, partial [Candidatus Omnitrophica bacterium]|nr:hypothetical protein [Candidatus Omnitrophota bacterium]
KYLKRYGKNILRRRHMDNNEYIPGQENREDDPIISVIQDIKDGVLNPKTLSQDLRQRCVDFFMREGYTEEQVGQILMRDERTIRRDLEKIQKQNSLNPNADLARQIIGDMFRKAMVHHRYLMRLARSPIASEGNKSQSEFLAWRVLKEVVEKMQTLGYLPLKPQEIVEDIFHHVTDDSKERSISEAKVMLSEIEEAARQAGTLDSETEKKIGTLKAQIAKAEINHEVDKLAKKEDKPEDKKEGSDEK